MPPRSQGRSPDHLAASRDVAKVLIVDDRQDNLIALEAILQGLPLQAVAVSSGEEALKRLLLDEYALILLDAQMPEMDGFETADHIKQRERTRHVPIIFFTAADRDVHQALRGYTSGAVDFINKPFDPWMLRAKVWTFVDLWRTTRQLREQAALTASRDATLCAVRTSLDEAAEELRTALPGDGVTVRAQVEKAIVALDWCRRLIDEA